MKTIRKINEIELPIDCLTNLTIEHSMVCLEGYDVLKPNIYIKKQFMLQSGEYLKIKIKKNNVQKAFHYGKFFPISEKYKYSYVCLDSYIIKKDKDDLLIVPYTRKEHLKQELCLLLEYLCLHGRIEIRGIKVRLFYYLFYKKKRKVKKKPILVFSDRQDKAGDNAEVLYHYVNKYHKDEVDAYFAIQLNSKDAEKLSHEGKTIHPGGRKYKKLYWLGALMISSQGEDWIFRPYKGGTEAYKDLTYQTKFIFLQHGVTKDDLSAWLNKENKNISLLVTATKPEYHSFVEANYGYTNEQVKLTGFPRYDLLYSCSQKKITILMTWRNYLVNLPDETGKRTLKLCYENSNYKKMLDELVVEEELPKLIEKYGYQLQIMLHPCMEEVRSHLEKVIDKRVNLLPYSQSYRDIFAESNLIITDYSSVAFDFAYLRKPVVYFQPDKSEFFSGEHMYKKGYYNYETNGFGEVVTKKEDLLGVIESYLQTECSLNVVYKQRIEATFPYNDRNNCERIWKEIKKIWE